MSEEVKVQLDDLVIVGVRSYGDKVEYREAIVFKVGRVWIHLIDRKLLYRTWKMRLDTQDEATGTSYGGSFFRTLKQHADAAKREEAMKVLRYAGIELTSFARIKAKDERVIALAAAVRDIIGDPA